MLHKIEIELNEGELWLLETLMHRISTEMIRRNLTENQDKETAFAMKNVALKVRDAAGKILSTIEN